MIKKVASLNKSTHQINKIVGNSVVRGFNTSQFRREEGEQAAATSSNAETTKRVPRKKRFATLAVEEEVNSSSAAPVQQEVKKEESTTPQRFEAFRYSIPWKDAEYYNEEKLENEMRRIFEICHGCRRCFNLCESFPSLFDMIDKVEVLEKVPSSEFKKISDKCTMCDLCYNTKCPYVPPHEFNIDFPHLMLRYRAVEQKKKNESHITQNPPIQLRETTGFLTKDSPNKEFEAPVHEGVERKLTLQKESELSQQLLTKMDRNGFLLTRLPQSISYFFMNNSIIRTILDKLNLVHKKAYLPPFTFGTLMEKLNTSSNIQSSNPEKVVIYTTCLGNYNKPELVEYSKYILEKNGVEVAIDYKMCCGMPYFEQGDLAAVSKSAETVSDFLVNNYISKGYKVVTVVPSCSLMLKSEWANVLPENENVQSVKRSTMDITEYLVYLAKKNGGKLPTHDQIKEIPYSITLHHACHARAQNMGNKGLDILKFIPNAKVSVIQRCSGHGGSFGTKKDHFDTAVKFGMPVAKKILQDASKSKTTHVMSSECPLAQEHLAQVTEMSKEEKQGTVSTITSNGNDHNIQTKHPIEILYEAYQK